MQKPKKLPRDANSLAARIVALSTGQEEPNLTGRKEEPPAKPEKNPAAVALGRLGGLKGGPARAEKLSEKRRKEIGKRAAAARWNAKKEIGKLLPPDKTKHGKPGKDAN
jgi:hypothetical protein